MNLNDIEILESIYSCSSVIKDGHIYGAWRLDYRVTLHLYRRQIYDTDPNNPHPYMDFCCGGLGFDMKDIDFALEDMLET